MLDGGTAGCMSPTQGPPIYIELILSSWDLVGRHLRWPTCLVGASEIGKWGEGGEEGRSERAGWKERWDGGGEARRRQVFFIFHDTRSSATPEMK